MAYGVPFPIPDGKLEILDDTVSRILKMLGTDIQAAGFRTVLTTTPIRVASANQNRVLLNVRNYSVDNPTAIIWLLFANTNSSTTSSAYPLRLYESYEWNLLNLYQGEVWAVASVASGQVRYMEAVKRIRPVR